MNASAAAITVDPVSASSSKSRTAIKWSVLFTLVIAAAIYGAHWWAAGRYRETTDDAYVSGDVTVIGPKVSGRRLREHSSASSPLKTPIESE